MKIARNNEKVYCEMAYILTSSRLMSTGGKSAAAVSQGSLHA
jgi:hypothetical protein